MPTNREQQALSPSARVTMLLENTEESPTVFSEMSELGETEWRETARWVKFEEAVEKGGNRWSKPHVATLSLHSLFELRSFLSRGLVDTCFPHNEISHVNAKLASLLVENGTIGEWQKNDLLEVLRRKHVHQYQQKKGGDEKSGFLSTIRSRSSMGKSSAKNSAAQLEMLEVEQPSGNKDAQDASQTDPAKGNTNFMRKLPPGAEAQNVLIGEVDFLQHHLCAFIRLKNSTILGDLTEVPVPTRFIFLLLGPKGHLKHYREVGRAMATLLADDIFSRVSYQAGDCVDLLAGVDEFLEQTTVLPPSEWDPKLRIEPPNRVPSQQKRIDAGKKQLANPHGHGPPATHPHHHIEEEEHEGHGNDPALKRTGKLFGGLILDIKRKVPHYFSDFTDALNLQCLATICFMYFALLAPIVTFGGLLEEATHQRMAAMENIFGGAICGVIYHLFSGQPLTIIGSTGPVLVFETIVYDMCSRMGIEYLPFRVWVHIWTAAIIFLLCITDASALVSFITRFTEESFATLISFIFIYEAVMKLLKIKAQLEVINFSRDVVEGTCYCLPPDGSGKVSVGKAIQYLNKHNLSVPHNETYLDYTAVPISACNAVGGSFGGDACYVMYDKLLMSILLSLGTFFFAVTFKKMRNSCYFSSRVRQVFSDFAVMLAIFIMTLVDMYVGINTPKLNVPSTFRPTYHGRGWLIPLFDGNPIWTAGLAFFPAILACILIFMDQQITTVIVNRKENKLKKGCGYHLDLLVLSALILIVGFLGLPIYIAATVLSINHINSLKVESESKAPGEVAQFIGVREQRVTGMVTFLLIGLSVFITGILSKIPMPVLYGVFLYMGISALGGIQLFDRILLFFMPMKYQPDTIYIRHVPIRRIHLFTACQVACLAILWTVKSIKTTSITFPVMLVVMVVIRKLMERFFSEDDLKYLDDPMPDFTLRKREDTLKQHHNTNSEEFDLDTKPKMNGNSREGSPKSAVKRMNISEEVNKSTAWKHINECSSEESSDDESNDSKNDQDVAAQDDESEHIEFKVRISPEASNTEEGKPLLNGKEDNPV